MKTGRGDHVAAKSVAREAKGPKKPPEKAGRAARQIGIAWIGAAYVRSKRTAGPRRVCVVGKGILRGLPFGGGARNGPAAQRHERGAVDSAAYHRLSQSLPLGGIRVHHAIKKPPESAHILIELAHHQVGSVTAEILLRRRVFSRKQTARQLLDPVEQGPVGVFAILVRISEQKFSQRDDIGVL